MTDSKLRVTFNEDDIQDKKNEEDGKSEEEDEDDEDLRQFNKFKLLNLVDSPEDNDIDDATDGDEEIDIPSEEVKQAKQQGDEGHKAKKGRRGKRGRKSKPDRKKTLKDEFDLDNIEKSQQDLNDTGKPSADSNLNPGPSHTKSELLKLDMRYLLPENEFKRMFGKSVVRDEKSKESRARSLRLSGSTPGLSKSRFSSNSIHDARLLGQYPSPTMELDEFFNYQQQLGCNEAQADQNPTASKKKATPKKNSDQNQPIYFKFVHEKSYQMAQNNFLNIAERALDEGIIHNLEMFPCHVESLLQFSDMVKVNEDYKSASEMVEHALLILERGFHPRFNLATGNCRMSYRRPENRTFFITIFKHINYLNRRGLRRTPLEYSKLLLSLDPVNDPLFSTLLIDFFAIRSEEYEFFFKFVAANENLTKLPNILFSLPLAHFLRSKNSKYGKTICESYLKAADELLQEALIKFPNFIVPLLDACLAEPDPKLTSCDYFNYTVYSNKYKLVPTTVDLLITLYIQRTLVLWKNKDVLSWLEKNISIMVQKFADGQIKDVSQNVNHWESFKKLPRNLLRHIVLSDTKVKPPPNVTGSSFLDIDPYPPTDSILSYSRQHSESMTSQDLEESRSAFHIAGLFIRTLWPGYNAGSSN